MVGRMGGWMEGRTCTFVIKRSKMVEMGEMLLRENYGPKDGYFWGSQDGLMLQNAIYK